LLFNSLEFLLFFPVVVAAYYALPARLKRPFLLAASYVFYMSWNPAYGPLLFAVSFLSYASARLVERDPRRARAWMWAGVAAHLSVIFVFKYYSFFTESAGRLLAMSPLRWQAPALEILLPVGISFYVFQSLSYVVDVYRRRIPAERSLAAHLLYVSFFPQLVAGPIERSADLSPQLKEDHRFDGPALRAGLTLVASGLFKKVVMAEGLSTLVAAAFSGAEPRGGLSLFLGAVLARYMIYCDIAGYTDIALGCGRAFGIRLSRNFARPFAARNISEYWQRWHMTVSGWFRDYVFYSLAASPLSRLGLPVLVFTTFLLLGLWHGASWNFVLWGVLNGLLMVAYQSTRSWRDRLPRVPDAVSVAFTFLALVCLPTVLVVTKDAGQALDVFRRVFSAPGGLGLWADVRWLFEGDNAHFFLSSLAFIAGLEVVQKIQEKGPFLEAVRRLPAGARWAVYLLLAGGAVWAVLIVSLSQYRAADFIYLRF
jgi:D-alanyl-lipoteichoic acid acyltransferase DltB (MBOAT superfamily)